MQTVLSRPNAASRSFFKTGESGFLVKSQCCKSTAVVYPVSPSLHAPVFRVYHLRAETTVEADSWFAALKHTQVIELHVQDRLQRALAYVWGDLLSHKTACCIIATASRASCFLPPKILPPFLPPFRFLVFPCLSSS